MRTKIFWAVIYFLAALVFLFVGLGGLISGIVWWAEEAYNPYSWHDWGIIIALIFLGVTMSIKFIFQMITIFKREEEM